MNVISVQIVTGITQILPWSIIGGYSEGCTLLDLYDSIVGGRFDLGSWNFPDKYKNGYVNTRVEVGKSKTDCNDQVMKSLRVLDVTSVFGRYVRFTIQEESNSLSQSKNSEQGPSGSDETDPISEKRQNAFNLLMNAQKNLSLPKPQTLDGKVGNNKKVVYNKVLDILQKARLGFTSFSMNAGNNMIHAVTNALWYVDPFIDRLNDRGCFLPALFEHLVGYNAPKKHKHKLGQIDKSSLLAHSQQLEVALAQPWINGPLWLPIKTALKELAEMIHKYHIYLENASHRVQSNHLLQFPVRSTKDDMKSLHIISPKYVVKPTFASRYQSLTRHLTSLQDYEPLCVNEFAPVDLRSRRYYIDNINQAIPHKCVLYRVAAGNNLGTQNFLWKIPMHQDEERLSKNQEVVSQIQKDIPVYHTRAMRREFIDKTALICSLKTMHARNIYKSLTGDCSAAANVNEKEVDERVQEAFSQQDPEIIQDLREHNKGQPTKYDTFFEKTKQYLETVVETAVSDRRHDKFTFLASAISVPDLRRQVIKLCPPETEIPSEQWIRFQFAPKNATSYASLQYTGKLNIKFQVQSRQLRKDHPDMHYASAIFHYMKVLAVTFSEYVTFLCMDDKHHCKVGEPGQPVAAVERGKRVIVGEDKVFAVADHDFTKFSIIPSVTMKLDIPDSIYGSFYRGQVYVGVKDIILEPSSPLRHITECDNILKQERRNPILLIYTDGGPDHRLTYLSVQLSLVCLFLKGDYDMLVAARTPPMNSWKNPPERIMSILNLALQSVGLMREKQTEEFEKKLKSLSGISKLREFANKDEKIREQMQDTIEPVKILLTRLFERLQLKEKPFKTFTPSSEDDMKKMWDCLSLSGDSLETTDMKQAQLQRIVQQRPELKAFLDHCTISRSYFFCIKKCGDQSCTICREPNLPPDVFHQLYHFPDPVPGEDGHYKCFEDVFGTETSEEHRPSLKKNVSLSSGHNIPFSPSAQTAKTAKTVVKCSDCEKPRVVYSATKLSNEESELLNRIIYLYNYSCGSTLQDLKTHDNSTPRVNKLLEKCYPRANLTCEMAIEVPYFSSSCFRDLCYHCGQEDNLNRNGSAYPVCNECKSKPIPLKRKHAMTAENAKKKKK